jgi:hypothetical protein
MGKRKKSYGVFSCSTYSLHSPFYQNKGKPGLVCVEGTSENVDQFLLQLRNLSWKKLSSRHKELTEVRSDGGIYCFVNLTGQVLMNSVHFQSSMNGQWGQEEHGVITLI